MFHSSWFPWRLAQQHKGRTRPSHAPKLRRGTRLACERLEDRTVPSLFTVTHLGDSGGGSLRQAILDANSPAYPGADSIDFAPGLAGTIPLISGQLTITDDLTIYGPGADVIRVSGTQASRVFEIASPVTASISGLTIADARLVNPGGGIYNAGTLTVSDSTMSGNVVVGWFGDGGGIYNAGTLTVSHSTLSGNSASSVGGGIYNAGMLTVSHCTLSGNYGYNGGGIANLDGTLAISDSTLSDNSSTVAGGGISSYSDGPDGGTVTVSNSTLSGNSVLEGFGGGIYNEYGTLTVSNSTLSGNFAGSSFTDAEGGGIATYGGTGTVMNSTLSGNSAEGYGGGIESTTALTVGNTIIAGNSAIITGPDVSGTFSSLGHNLIGIGDGATGFNGAGDQVGTIDSPIDPLLGPLHYNGGPTWTRALLPGSPAIDAGHNTDAPPFDQRGLARIVDGNEDGTATIDIGAYEAQTAPPVNTPPLAYPQSVTTAEDTAKAITLTASDADGDFLTYTVVSSPAHGTLSGSGANLTYTPVANYNGPDSFTFKANDGQADSNLATVSITVTAVNDAPVAQAQSISTPEDTAYSGQVVATDVDSTSLIYIIVAGPAHGTLTWNSNGSFTYRPAANYSGPDSFIYKANDGQADSNLATVSITVIAVNDAPVNSVQGTRTMHKNTSLIFSSGSRNAISIADVDAGSALVQVTLAVNYGTLTLSGTTGLSFSFSDANGIGSGDGTADTTMTFRGTIEDINAALDGLRFTPPKRFTGTVTLTLTTNDLGNNGIGVLRDEDAVTIVVQ